MSVAPFCVIIPAHNEERVIERCLTAIYAGAPPHARPEVIVAANGCTDRTVAMARELAPDATVLDLPVGSKVIAMNEANRIATATPRFFLDADIACSYASLAATAEVLREPGVMAASPAIRIDVSGCDRWVRAYYRIWLRLPYVTDRLVGSGVFGLSAEGLKIMGEIPQIIGDDIWVRTRFSYAQRRNVGTDQAGNPACFTVLPPLTIGSLIKIEARRKAGNEDVLKQYPSPHDERINRPADFGRLRAEGAALSDIAIYLAIKLTARALCRWNRARGRASVWLRDDSSRTAARPPAA